MEDYQQILKSNKIIARMRLKPMDYKYCTTSKGLSKVIKMKQVFFFFYIISTHCIYTHSEIYFNFLSNAYKVFEMKPQAINDLNSARCLKPCWTSCQDRLGIARKSKRNIGYHWHTPLVNNRSAHSQLSLEGRWRLENKASWMHRHNSQQSPSVDCECRHTAFTWTHLEDRKQMLYSEVKYVVTLKNSRRILSSFLLKWKNKVDNISIV